MDAVSLGVISLAVAAIGVAVWALYRARAAERRLADVDTRLSDAVIQLQGLSAGAVGQGQHIARVEADVARLRDRLEQVASREGGDVAFGQAIRLARRGESAEQIVQTCGLSRMEAELAVRLHREH